MIWYMIGIHLSGKVEPSFLPNTLDNKMPMICTLFLNLEVFHSANAYLALNCPSDQHPFIIVRKLADSLFCLSHSGVTLIWASFRWYILLKTHALYLATLLFSGLRIDLFSWYIFLVIQSITSGHGSTGVLIVARCSPDLMIFLYTSFLISMLTSFYNNIWNSLSWNAWNSEFHVKVTFLSTRHSVSAKIHIPCSFVGSLTIFLSLFNIEVDSILLLKQK